jgi:quinol monooxygenase YgiN
VTLFIFARFHAKLGCESALERVVRDVVASSRAEPGCEQIQVFCSTQNHQLFYIHSRWQDEAAFDLHAQLPHTIHFLEQVQLLIDHPLEVVRAHMIA